VVRILKNINYIMGGKKKPYGLVFVFLLLAVLDVAGVGVVPLLVHSILVKGTEGGTANFLATYFDATDKNELITIMCCLLLLVFSVKSIVLLVSNYAIFKFSYRVMHKNRAELIDLILDSSFELISNKSTADFINLLQLHINQTVSNYLVPLLRLISDLLVAFAIFLFLIVTMPEATLILAFILISTITLYLYLMRGKLYRYGRSSYKYNHGMIDLAKSVRLGFVDIVINNGRSYFRKLFKKCSSEMSEVQLKSTFLRIIPRATLEWIVVTFVLVLVFVNSRGGGDSRELVTILATFGVASMRLLPISNSIATSLTVIRNTEPVVEKYIRERELLRSNLPFNQKSIVEKKQLLNDRDFVITLENVSFSFPDKKTVLNDISLKLTKGKTIGIIGESGAGKSTLISLILGLLSPTSGRVLINGDDLSEIKSVDFFSYVPQFPFVSNDTLINNITFSNENLSRDLILQLLNDLGLSEIVNGEVATLETLIGENGINLSGGQVQRIALVRAFIRERPFLVIDEATSALDDLSSERVIKQIEKIKNQTSLLIVTHRKDVLEICDDIFELSDGSLQPFRSPKKKSIF